MTEYYEQAVPTIAYDSLRADQKLGSEQQNLLKSASSVLILDSVLVAGSRFENLNKLLRENFGHLTRVDFLVALARPTSAAHWKKLVGALTTKHQWEATLGYVENLWLPDWDNTNCPWCVELEKLSLLARSEPSPEPYWTERLSLLNEKTHGLKSPFLLFDGEVMPNLGAQSVLLEEGATPMAVLFALASGLEQLRQEQKLKPGFPVFGVLDFNNFTRYSENLIRCAILRCSLLGEWPSRSTTEFSDKISSVLSNSDARTVSAEILLAYCLNKLPKKLKTVLEPIFQEHVSAVLLLEL